jgi:hypothetical protein
LQIIERNSDHREARGERLISLLHIRVGQKGVAQLLPAGVVSGGVVFSAAHFRRWSQTSSVIQLLDGSNSNTSSRERAGKKKAGLSPDARALKCALPQLILALSLSRKSSVNKLLFVSTTR